MKYYLAPLEGITTRAYRQLSRKFFGCFDRYYTPFLTPTHEHLLTNRQRQELEPVEPGLVPQLLTNVPEDFIWMAGELKAMGYGEVNLNLGCPSGTVVKKHKGSGLLMDLDRLKALLDPIFAASPLPVSIKTRIGIEDPEEFAPLLALFNEYPICELTVHPRLQKQQYGGEPHMDCFAYAQKYSKNPLCYNGDLFSPEDVAQQEGRVMLGRGAIANPGMIRYLKQGKWASLEEFRAFHDEIYAHCKETMSGFRPVVFKMREFWCYWQYLFDAPERHLKKIRKAASFAEYGLALDGLFLESRYRPDGAFLHE